MIFSGYQTKWAKELEKSYTYLIPDSGFKKLWYSTLIEHIRARIDGMLLTIPGGIGLGLSPVYMILTIAVYVCLNANKLYINMLVDALIGVSLGNTGKTLLRSIIQFTVFVMAVVVAVLFAIFLDSPQMGFVAIVVFLASVTFGIAIGAATSFDKMEKIDA